jgi:hypothetical protein
MVSDISTFVAAHRSLLKLSYQLTVLFSLAVVAAKDASSPGGVQLYFNVACMQQASIED